MTPPASSPKTKYVLACVDGTNSASWRQANTLGGTKAGANYSHVFDIHQKFQENGGLKLEYEDGPVLSGAGSEAKVSSISKRIKDYIAERKKQGMKFRPLVPGGVCSIDSPKFDCEIVLFGHSRGAVICADIAANLASVGVGVYFLGLFDAVDRAASLEGGSAKNVLFTYHARRDPAALRMTRTKSRASFGNDIETSRNNYQEVYFQTSHGGVGGAPRLDYDELGVGDDLSCAGISKKKQDLVKAYENPNFATMITTNYFERKLAVVIEKAWLRKGSVVTQLCIQQSNQAMEWMLQRARNHGLPV